MKKRFKLQLNKKHSWLANMKPSVTIIISFAIIIFVGAILLSLPISSKNGTFTSFLDSLFTSTTATCITGLVVVDTGEHWNFIGQAIILLLVQIGGLGMITFATFFATMIRHKFSLSNLQLAQESASLDSLNNIRIMIKRIVVITFGVEGIGALLLSLRFIPQFGFYDGLWKSIFHSISAFCNAGLDIFGGGYKSFVDYQNDPYVLLVLTALIVIGGVGFIVWSDLMDYKKKRRIHTYTKLVLIATGCLLFGGMLLYFFSEYANTLEHLTIGDKLVNSLFHSASARTAGFNSLNTTSFYDSTKFFTILLMFIGGASGSTAGGVKLTTISVLVMVAISQIKGRSKTIAFNKKINPQDSNKALAIVLLSIGLIFLTTSFLLFDPNLYQLEIPFLDMLFEATSAFGTVGIATFTNAALSGFSKLVIILTMFLGRIGPLSFAMFLTSRSQNNNSTKIYPEAKILVG